MLFSLVTVVQAKSLCECSFCEVEVGSFLTDSCDDCNLAACQRHFGETAGFTTWTCSGIVYINGRQFLAYVVRSWVFLFKICYNANDMFGFRVDPLRSVLFVLPSNTLAFS